MKLRNRYKKRKLKFDLFTAMIGVLVLCIVTLIVVPVGVSVSSFFHKSTYVSTVTDKQVKRKGDSDNYLIFTEDKDGDVRVLSNEDSLFRLKFDSSDVFADIKKGKTYEFDVVGYRIPFFSMYENILEYKEVK